MSDDLEAISDDDSPPLEMISSARHFTRIEIGEKASIDRDLTCPVCLGIIRNATATECLHRFCADCIETSIRLGKTECPTCRAVVATRRAAGRLPTEAYVDRAARVLRKEGLVILPGLLEAADALEQRVEVAAREVLHDEVQVVLALEAEEELDERAEREVGLKGNREARSICLRFSIDFMIFNRRSIDFR